MAGITGIPTTRVSDLFIRTRLLTQMQSDQIALSRIQEQISTGRRLSLLSDDAPAAIRSVGLQSLIERKEQVKRNIDTNQLFLGATDTALSAVSSLISNVQSSVLSVADTVSSDAQRAAAQAEVEQALNQLVNTGNQQFRGRYLFAGGRTTDAPFEFAGNQVRYLGNEQKLQSYADVDLLFESNIDGNEVFGAISDPVLGTADLNPALTVNTRLSDLRGGAGITDGSIQISDGTSISTIDLSRAETIGDVAAMIENSAPAGRTLSVEITATGLRIELDSAGGGNLLIREAGNTSTAAQLGILNDTPAGTGPLVGSDLNPLLRKTTLLSNVFGVQAAATLDSPGGQNNVVITANDRGPATNGVVVSYVDGGAGVAGSESAVYDAGAGTLTITIADGITTADDVIDVINNDATISQNFSASNDPDDTDGSLPVDASATATLSGGTGFDFDQDSGILIENGGETYLIDLTDAETVEDVLNEFNSSGASVIATINDSGTGIDVRSRLSGSDFSIGENGGQTAAQLGIRSFNTDTRLNKLNHGIGVHTNDGTDFRVQLKGGTRLDIDVSSAGTIQDVLDLINNHVDNQDPTTQAIARLAATGNGIELFTNSTSANAPLAVIRTNFSQAAENLGLIPVGADQSAAAVALGSGEAITGRDVNVQEVQGIFNALIRLREALATNDLNLMTRASQQLDEYQLKLTLSRANVGSRQQSLDVLKTRVEDEEIELRSALSLELDTEITSAISEFTSRQISLEATLSITARISQLTLLDYL